MAESDQRTPRETKPARVSLLTFDALCRKLGVSARTGRDTIHAPWMPAPLQLGPRILRWVETEVDEALVGIAPRCTERLEEPANLVAARERRRAEGVAQ